MKNNKIIAEFMGYKLAKCNNGLAWERPTLSCIHDNYSLHGRLWREKDSYYKWKTSWDWLMPVVNKIRVPYNNTEITGEKYEDIISVLAEGCIEANQLQVYEAVVEFIKWYNLNT